MGLSIGQVAALTGVTVRTLHHYDDLGLVTASRNEVGHRRYDDEAVEQLQEVLFWRELDFSLDEIAALLADPDHDREAALRRQHALLRERAERTDRLIKALEATMNASENGTRLTDQEMLEVFGQEYAEKHHEYRGEAREAWGDSDPYRESSRRTSTYSKDQWVRIKAEGDATMHALAEAKRSGAPSDSEVAMDAAEAAREHIDRWFYPCSHEMHAGLGDMYAADPRFTKTYDDVEPGLAEYVRDAILANGLRHA